MLLSPFLNIGTRLPCFHISGKIPSRHERLNKMQSGFAITLETFLTILLLIISGQEALLGSKFSSTSLTSSSVISIVSKELSVSSTKGGKSACESSSDYSDAK